MGSPGLIVHNQMKIELIPFHEYQRDEYLTWREVNREIYEAHVRSGDWEEARRCEYMFTVCSDTHRFHANEILRLKNL